VKYIENKTVRVERENNFKQQTIKGMMWSFIEKFGSLLFQFISNIVLARLLMPSDFGLIGLIMVFIAICNTIVEGGFGSALVQKQNVNQKDFSTIFILNIIFSITLFILLFFTAPVISIYFKESLLKNVLRVLGLVLVFNALSIVQYSQLIRNVNFKLIAKINLLSSVIASSISIIAALLGLGVWSLVIQLLGLSFFKTLFLWIWNSWKPQLLFDKTSAKELLGFGSKLLISGLVDTIYVNIYTVIIGKKYSQADLGFYTQAKKMQDVPTNTISGVINQVTFPIFSKYQDDLDFLKSGLRKSLTLLAFISIPILTLLALIASPLFNILLTEKWNESVLYFQLFCFSGMLLTTHTINLNILKARGRTDFYLISEVCKKIVGIILLIVGLRWGIIGIVSSLVLNAYISFFINAFFTSKVIQYSIFEQFKDIFPTLILSVLIGSVVYIITKFVYLPSFLLLMSQTVLFIGFFILSAKIMRLEAFGVLNLLLKERMSGILSRMIKTKMK